MIERRAGVRCRWPDGGVDEAPTGYDHFARDD
jgi:hypothetical protein